jgi:tRNA(Leu) C34 or U34 (ribose-2'-O)-methylase TrmL
MNVHDHLKPLTVAEIKTYYQTKTIPVASAMMHVTGDFNLSTLIRNSNFFGYNNVFYVGGKKQYDRRGTVGTHNYIDVNFLKTEEEFVALMRQRGYKIISIENNIEYPSSDFFGFVEKVDVNKLGAVVFVFGEEQKGLSDYILKNSDHILYIPGYGTVRSLNVGTASGIVLGCYARLYNKQ